MWGGGGKARKRTRTRNVETDMIRAFFPGVALPEMPLDPPPVAGCRSHSRSDSADAPRDTFELVREGLARASGRTNASAPTSRRAPPDVVLPLEDVVDKTRAILVPRMRDHHVGPDGFAAVHLRAAPWQAMPPATMRPNPSRHPPSRPPNATHHPPASRLSRSWDSGATCTTFSRGETCDIQCLSAVPCNHPCGHNDPLAPGNKRGSNSAESNPQVGESKLDSGKPQANPHVVELRHTSGPTPPQSLVEPTRKVATAMNVVEKAVEPGQSRSKHL